MEHTGHYGALLTSEFVQHQGKLSLINPVEIKRSSGLTRGKNDAVDAYRIASYAASHTHKLTHFQLDNLALQELKLKLAQRSFYTKAKVQAKNNLQSLKVLAQSSDCEHELEVAKGFIDQYRRTIANIEKQIRELIAKTPELQTTFDKITKIPGVALVTAATCIVLTGNFTKFTNARKFCCHAGLAPFSHESGSSIKAPNRTSHFRNKALKALLMRAGMTAGTHDPQLKAYKKRKRAEGKDKMVVNNALASKVVARIFAVAMREEPYVKLAA